MKKYPITYKGELYEVRWETIGFVPRITIYKVTTSKFLKFKIYKKMYRESEYDVNKQLDRPNLLDDPIYYIQQVKTIFKL